MGELWGARLPRLGRVARYSLALALSLVGLDASSQPDDGLTLAQFHHTAWTHKQGAPADVTALAHGTDGWLWLGTQSGLYRFDGIRFERYEAVGRGISALLALPDGRLWIGHTTGGATLLENGRATLYGNTQGLPASSSVQAFALDRKGRLWASAGIGLYRFGGSHWMLVPIRPASSTKPVLSVASARDGSIWVRAGDGIFMLREDAVEFERVSMADRMSYLAASPDGSVWTSGYDRGLRRLSPRAAAPRAPSDKRSGAAGQIFFDREGRLWGSLEPGLVLLPGSSLEDVAWRETAGAASEALTKERGLSGKYPFSFAEDTEGDVWIGTDGGLDRFRRNKLHAVSLPDSEGAAIAAGEQGEVWVKRWELPAVRLDGAAVREEVQEKPGTPSSRFICAYRDPRGTVWVCGKDSLLQVSSGTIERVPYPPRILAMAGNYVQGLATDRSGGLWLIGGGGSGLMRRLADGTWAEWHHPDGAGLRIPRAIAHDDRDRLWLGHRGNRVAMLDGDKLRVLSSAEGLQVGDVNVIHPHGERLWIGGSDGVALFDNGRFRAITGEGGNPIRGVSGLVETRAGELWMNGADGVTRISKSELDLLLRDPAHAPTVERFDTEDGLDGVPRQVLPLPTMIEASDGKLWFSTSAGLYWIDPAHIARNALPPPVLIRAVRAGDKSFDVAEGMQLPQRTTSLAISYAALSLAIPERVRFRYHLDGVDESWQDAGTRRQAFYTKLGPGHYRFHVIAANDDGVWNETGAALDFSIQPAFFETTWFRAACFLLALAALYGLYRWRLRLAKARMQDKLRERLAERERIARELHDTLLQSVYGLVLRFETATQKLAKNEPVRPMFEAALEHADEVLIEGRDRVLDLRASGTAVGLTTALTNAGRELSQDHPAQFDTVTLGRPRELHPAVSDEVLHVAREALLNAFRHAGAGRVEVTLDYDELELRLSVRDDGCGIDGQVIAAGGRPGHWGLAGMRERAHKIGAELEIHSERGRGTRIELAVPAELAYRDFVSLGSRLWPRWLRLRRGAAAA